MDLNSILNKKDIHLQFESISDPHTTRCKIKTGYICNAECNFCYYDKMKTENLKFDLIKKQLEVAKLFGMDSVDFSGGESTIHKSFKLMISEAKDMGFKNICVITNGLTFDNVDFMKECIDLGLNDILLSLHGPSGVQKKVIGVDSAYSKAIKTIRNANKLGLRMRINSVVSNLTYKRIPELVEIIKDFNVYNYNMIMFKYCFDQTRSSEVVTHTKSSEYIKEAIENCKGYVDVINVRYIPFCFMNGYEKYVTNFHQKKHDQLEWNNALFFRFEFQDINNLCLNFLNNDPEDENNYMIEKYSVSDYSKTNKCLKCKNFLLCDGFENGYIEHIDIEKEATAQPGKKIKDPLYYRRSK